MNFNGRDVYEQAVAKILKFPKISQGRSVVRLVKEKRNPGFFQRANRNWLKTLKKSCAPPN
jgi:hypothetical protein